MNKAEKIFLRGKASKDLEHYAAAIEDFSKAIELDPTHEDVCDFYFERGECLVQLKNFPAAIADFDKAIEFEPQYIRAYFERGKCFEQLEKISAAVEDFSRVIEEFPDPSDELSAEAYYRRGKIHERTKNFAASEKIFNKPSDNEPIDDEKFDDDEFDEEPTDELIDEQLIHAWQNFAVPTLGHGKCSFDLGEFEVALKDFDAVIAAVPNAKNLFYTEYDGWDYYAFLDDMIDDLEKYFEPIINSRTFDEFNFNRVLVVLAYVGRGQCHKNFGDESKAQADFAEVKTLGFAVDNFDALKPILDI